MARQEPEKTIINQKEQPLSLADGVSALQAAVLERRPVLAEILSGGNLSLGAYLDTIESPHPAETIQPTNDVREAIVSLTRKLLGDETAEKVSNHMAADLVIDTSHHHAIEHFFLVLQTLVVDGLRGMRNVNKKGNRKPVIVALAGAGVPGDNAVMPLGLSFSRDGYKTGRKHQKLDPETHEPLTRTVPNQKKGEITVPVEGFETVTGALKVNVLPGKTEERAAVATMPAFTADQVQRARSAILGLFGSRDISYQEREAAIRVLDTVYSDERVLGQKSYSDQVTVANHLLFPLLFNEDVRDEAPELVYLSFEGVTSQLLATDLRNPDSLVSRILFDPRLRAEAMSNLETVPGCWDSQYAGHPTKGGTEFFWGIDGRDRSPVGMHLVEKDGQLALTGRNVEDIPFTPEGLTTALSEGKILPGLFLSFTALTFARGEVACYGGFMQTDYLTRMRDGLAQALNTSNYSHWAELVSDVPTANWILGMTPVVARYPEREVTMGVPTPYVDGDGQEQIGVVDTRVTIPSHVRPAGSLEIIAAGGLTRGDIDKLMQIPPTDAQALALPDTYSMVVSPEERDESLLAITPSDVYDVVRSGFVEKSLSFVGKERDRRS